MKRLLVAWEREPLFRVVRAGWPDPLDASFSQMAPENRWNSADFPALYCCSSESVARAIALDVLRFAGIDLEDLQPAWRPRLVEIAWTGEAVDVASAKGVSAAGFPPDYPAHVSKEITRRAAAAWHRRGDEGVLCRSASLWRLGFSGWNGPPSNWSEIALFVRNCRVSPALAGSRDDYDWLFLPPATDEPA